MTGSTNLEQEHFIIKSNKILHKVAFDTIIYVEANGDYVKVYTTEGCIITNSTFTNIISSLPEKQFVRTHKSFAINLSKLSSISGNTAIVLERRVPIGQKYKSEFMARVIR